MTDAAKLTFTEIANQAKTNVIVRMMQRKRKICLHQNLVAACEICIDIECIFERDLLRQKAKSIL
jgi:hypothetical protein